jgi:hypothetical protein
MSKRASSLVDYSLAFSICRESGHWWEYETYDPTHHAWTRKCVHGCGTSKVFFELSGKRRYFYPAGYLVKDSTKVDTAIHCRKLVERLIASRGITFVRRAGKVMLSDRPQKVLVGRN